MSYSKLSKSLMIGAGVLAGVGLIYYLSKTGIEEMDDELEKLSKMDKALLFGLKTRFPDQIDLDHFSFEEMCDLLGVVFQQCKMVTLEYRRQAQAAQMLDLWQDFNEQINNFQLNEKVFLDEMIKTAKFLNVDIETIMRELKKLKSNKYTASKIDNICDTIMRKQEDLDINDPTMQISVEDFIRAYFTKKEEQLSLMPSVMQNVKRFPDQEYKIVYNMHVWIQDRMYNETGCTEEQLNQAYANLKNNAVQFEEIQKKHKDRIEKMDMEFQWWAMYKSPKDILKEEAQARSNLSSPKKSAGTPSSKS